MIVNSPLLLFNEVLVIFNRHVLLHIEFWNDILDREILIRCILRTAREKDGLGSGCGQLGLPDLVLFQLLVEFFDSMRDVYPQIQRNLLNDFEVSPVDV